jgi:TonB family protein
VRRARTSLLCVAIVMFAVSAHAQDSRPRARLLTVPDAQTLGDNFPVVALATGVSGQAVLSCSIAPDGESECAAVEEAPTNMGFGAAAERIARDWRFAPRTENGQAVASRLRIPLGFQNESDVAVPIGSPIRVVATRGAALPQQAPADFQPPPPDESSELITASACASNRPSDCAPEESAQPPQGDAWSWHYPHQAYNQGLAGRALVSCVVRSNSSVDCAAERDAPIDLGFADAAVAVMEDALLRSAARIQPGMILRSVVTFHMREPGERIQLQSEWEMRRRPREAFYPQEALTHERQGSAILACVIQEDRTVDCSVLSETPAEFGFGLAAVRLRESMQVTEEAFGQPGLSAGDRIRTPITFRTQ